MSIKVKVILTIVAAIIALNIFLPERAAQAIEMMSQATGITEDKIQEGVDLATDITTDTAEAIKEHSEDALDN